MLNKDQFADNHFIHAIIEEDLKSSKHETIRTRFPPESSGYLRIGHVKSICLNFDLACIYDGLCNLRFDDTGPERENDKYVNTIKEDVEWLGFHQAGEPRFTSNYFDQLHDYAVDLIKDGKAYVDGLTPEEMRRYRNTLTEAGKNSPYRNRSIEENLDLFTRVKNGELPDGSRTLRLKVDVTSGNTNMHNPIIYRIRRAHHRNTGDEWYIYPMYNYTHCTSDAVEGITHFLRMLEFKAHRPLYSRVLGNIPVPYATRPRQYEFSRLGLLHSVTSKRRLNQLVSGGRVAGWDDPRMPTISGMRHRGYTPGGLRLFAKRAGISKSENIVDMSMLGGAVRERLENPAPRMMAVPNPLRVTLTNFQTALARSRTTPYHPNHEDMGSRELPISPMLYIEANDFSENPPKGFKRLTLGGEVCLHHNYVMECGKVVKGTAGNTVELKYSLDYDTLGKNPEGRKVKGVIHWLSARYAVPATVHLYDHLFIEPRPDAVHGEDDEYLPFTNFLSPESVRETTAHVEAATNDLPAENRWQFEWLGCFVTDRKDHVKGRPVFNRTVRLRDTWQAKT